MHGGTSWHATRASETLGLPLQAAVELFTYDSRVQAATKVAGQVRRRFAMRRFGILFSVLAVVLACVGALGSAPSVVAEEATPAAREAHCPSPLATPTASPAASPTASSLATPTKEPVCVGIVEGDSYVRPQRTTFRVGETYIFTVGNEGTEVHEFVIEPAGVDDAPLEAEVNGKEQESEIEDIAPGEIDELEWTFTEPGRYQFACHIPGHYEAGMVIEVEVVA
jgi:uncharacterized cupredoxin-like copper-binding protein